MCNIVKNCQTLLACLPGLRAARLGFWPREEPADDAAAGGGRDLPGAGRAVLHHLVHPAGAGGGGEAVGGGPRDGGCPRHAGAVGPGRGCRGRGGAHVGWADALRLVGEQLGAGDGLVAELAGQQHRLALTAVAVAAAVVENTGGGGGSVEGSGHEGVAGGSTQKCQASALLTAAHLVMAELVLVEEE